jgi:methylmalonyl-CoA mutase C-terminal domain/subunit
MTLFPRVAELLRERDADDIVVFGGGIIPDENIPRLQDAGLSMIFTPGTPLSAITDWVDDRFPQTD